MRTRTRRRRGEMRRSCTRRVPKRRPDCRPRPLFEHCPTSRLALTLVRRRLAARRRHRSDPRSSTPRQRRRPWRSSTRRARRLRVHERWPSSSQRTTKPTRLTRADCRNLTVSPCPYALSRRSSRMPSSCAPSCRCSCRYHWTVPLGRPGLSPRRNRAWRRRRPGANLRRARRSTEAPRHKSGHSQPVLTVGRLAEA